MTAVDTRCTISLFFARSEHVGPSFFSTLRARTENTQQLLLYARAESRNHRAAGRLATRRLFIRFPTSLECGRRKLCYFFSHSCLHGKRRYRRLSRQTVVFPAAEREPRPVTRVQGWGRLHTLARRPVENCFESN